MICLIATAAPAFAVSAADVDDSVRRGVQFLYERQNKFGNWENQQTMPHYGGLGNGADDGQWGGRTALCTYALLAAGERYTDPRLHKAVDFLLKAKITGSYALGIRANVWFYLPQTQQIRSAMLADAAALRRNRSTGSNAPNRGLFDYQAGGPRVDLSCSQYGVLGCWAAAQRVDAFDTGFWAVTEKAWCQNQNDDGGWSYNGHASTGSTIQMTAAGVATLFITQELAHASDHDKDSVEAQKEAADQIDRGLDWIGQHLAEHLQSPMMYALYGIERVGVASGYRYIGPIDWYQTCADAILAHQDRDGAWYGGQFDPAIETSFALLFLSRGRAPVMVDKLQYNLTPPAKPNARDGDPATQPVVANWNLRPRDMANITRWTEEHIERRLNWQIVKLATATTDDLHDAGLVYLTGDQPISLTDEETAKLKQFVEEGGLIVASSDGPKAGFAETFRNLGEKMFPGDKFAPVPADHVLLSGEQYPVRSQKHPVAVEALGNGARLFMILVPKADLSGVYQRREMGKTEAYEFFANAYLYSIEKSARSIKGETHIVRPGPATQPSQSATVGRLKYNGQWDPEPGGWRRLAAVMHNDADVELSTKTIAIDTGIPDSTMLAHLTGSGAFKLTDHGRRELKDYIDAGGLLLIDNCGGNAQFDKDVRAELAKIIPDAESQMLSPLPVGHAMFADAAGKPIAPKYRAFGLPNLGPLAKDFQLRGLTVDGKLAVIYSPQDLSVGLVGEPVDGITGYVPDVATALVRRIIELRMAKKL